jgi:hypothetical protein
VEHFSAVRFTTHAGLVEILDDIGKVKLSMRIRQLLDACGDFAGLHFFNETDKYKDLNASMLAPAPYHLLGLGVKRSPTAAKPIPDEIFPKTLAKEVKEVVKAFPEYRKEEQSLRRRTPRFGACVPSGPFNLQFVCTHMFKSIM